MQRSIKRNPHRDSLLIARSAKRNVLPDGDSTNKYDAHLPSENSGKSAESAGSPYWNDCELSAGVVAQNVRPSLHRPPPAWPINSQQLLHHPAAPSPLSDGQKCCNRLRGGCKRGVAPELLSRVNSRNLTRGRHPFR